MLLIWGWKTRFSEGIGGYFHCPREGSDSPYTTVEARKWFTFFWIPLIPLKILGTFIRCRSCGAEYEERVLTLPTNASMEDRLTLAVRHVVAATAKADGHIDERERAAAVKIVGQFTGDTDYDGADFERDLAGTSADFEQALIDAGEVLAPQGQELLIQASLLMAMADGELDDREMETLVHAGRALGMSPSHIRGVLADAMDSTRR